MTVLHPKSRAGANSTTRPCFDRTFTPQFRYQLPGRFRAASTPLTGSFCPLTDKSAYPLTPAHQVQEELLIARAGVELLGEYK